MNAESWLQGVWRSIKMQLKVLGVGLIVGIVVVTIAPDLLLRIMHPDLYDRSSRPAPWRAPAVYLNVEEQKLAHVFGIGAGGGEITESISRSGRKPIVDRVHRFWCYYVFDEEWPGKKAGLKADWLGPDMGNEAPVFCSSKEMYIQ